MFDPVFPGFLLETKRIKPKKETIENTMIFQDVYLRLKLMALNMFQWDGVPDSVNIEYLEKVLYSCGFALFFEDPNFKHMALKCTLGHKLNPYEEPINFHAISLNYHKDYTVDNSVLIKNNYEMYPTQYTIWQYTKRISEISRTIDINVGAQKTPILLRCDAKDRLSVVNLYDKYSGNAPVIITDKELSLNPLDVLKTDAPFVADKLYTLKMDLMNEVLTFLGLNNSNIRKRERLVTDEVNANNEEIDMCREIMLKTRQTACDKINQMFGLNMSVKFNENIEPPEMLEPPEKEDAKDE